MVQRSRSASGDCKDLVTVIAAEETKALHKTIHKYFLYELTTSKVISSKVEVTEGIFKSAI